MRSLTLLFLLALSLLAIALPLSHGTPSSNLRPSLSSSDNRFRRHKSTKAGMALMSQSPWLLRRLEEARRVNKNAPSLRQREETEVEVHVRRGGDDSADRIAACKGWKDGVSFWWTIFWDLRRLWRMLRGKPSCDVDVQGGGSGNPVDGSRKPGSGT
ncbi:hypothetical protein MMC18_005023 [Xylographa bjoerkii]|nr:hypothetical protein [Xylographa bjoerkii]